jgi:hypothetical protein
MQQASLNGVINQNALATTFVRPAPGHVLGWSVDPAHHDSAHDRSTRRALAERLASLKGYRYFGEVGGAAPPPGPLFYVPSDTIAGRELAHSMGIRQESDLFGGVVPFPYVATKAISHPLFGLDAAAPEGWVSSFAECIRHCVLDGFTAFSEADARRAGRWLLRGGSVRIKPVRATGGHGQTAVSDAASLDRVLAELPGIATDGVVLERNLREPRTLSVGQVTVGDLRVSYYGLQREVRNHRGESVYGGSDLTAVRGGLETLHAMPLSRDLHLAIEQARAYHAAVVDSFPGFMASRINYDVAQGLDDAGQWRSGVLEQSWRIGGASGAEIAALEAFRDQPQRKLVRASCFEVFGDPPTLPPGACVYHDGVDSRVGRLVKYSFVEPHVDPT